MTPEDAEFLYDYLVAICLYNERGHAMRQDTPADIANVRRGFRSALNLFIDRVGEHNLPVEVLKELRSDFVLEDGEGIVLRRLDPYLCGAGTLANALNIAQD